MEQNKSTKYLKYAIGEIILVVLGILIALSINNWNQNRKDRVIETEYLNRLVEETTWNIKQLEYNASIYLEASNQINQVVDYIENNTQDSITFNFNRPNYIHPWIIKKSTYNELIATGELKIIRDIALRDLLDEANSYAYFSEQQLENWRDLAIAHESFFIPYKKSLQKWDKSNAVYYENALDYHKMQGDKTIIELLKHWSVGNIVFYNGTNSLKEQYIKVLERIKCLKENKECPLVSKEIIKN